MADFPLEPIDPNQLRSAEKLILLVDLDETIIQTTKHKDAKRVKGEIYEMKPKRTNYHLKIRPDADRFLKFLSSKFELYACTKSRHYYAKHIVDILDPNGALFQNRIISREHFSSTTKEDILPKICIGGDTSLICVLDDKKSMWPNFDQVIKVKKFNFWDSLDEVICESRKSSSTSLLTTDKRVEIKYNDLGFLLELLGLLNRVHLHIYNQLSDEEHTMPPSLASVISQEVKRSKQIFKRK